jgi:hypothetical protein
MMSNLGFDTFRRIADECAKKANRELPKNNPYNFLYLMECIENIAEHSPNVAHTYAAAFVSIPLFSTIHCVCPITELVFYQYNIPSKHYKVTPARLYELYQQKHEDDPFTEEDTDLIRVIFKDNTLHPHDMSFMKWVKKNALKEVLTWRLFIPNIRTIHTMIQAKCPYIEGDIWYQMYDELNECIWKFTPPYTEETFVRDLDLVLCTLIKWSNLISNCGKFAQDGINGFSNLGYTKLPVGASSAWKSIAFRDTDYQGQNFHYLDAGWRIYSIVMTMLLSTGKLHNSYPALIFASSDVLSMVFRAVIGATSLPPSMKLNYLDDEIREKATAFARYSNELVWEASLYFQHPPDTWENSKQLWGYTKEFIDEMDGDGFFSALFPTRELMEKTWHDCIMAERPDFMSVVSQERQDSLGIPVLSKCMRAIRKYKDGVKLSDPNMDDDDYNNFTNFRADVDYSVPSSMSSFDDRDSSYNSYESTRSYFSSDDD